MRVYRIYLIRHGMTTANIEGKYVGVTDVPLCEEGIIQLENLKEEFDYPNVGKVYSSPLQRCIQTAQTIYDDITPNIVEDLKEFNFGKYEGASAKDVADDKEFIAWLNSGFTTKMEGAEDGKEFLDRIVNGLNQIILDMMK
ncbi:MAG: histidine phosphatase family protein, partial [Oscillospiraceae bacterium]